MSALILLLDQGAVRQAHSGMKQSGRKCEPADDARLLETQ